MSILENAIDAIKCGLEDYNLGTPARLKSALRNVHAGALLLFKEKLVRLSGKGTDEVLIKQRIVPEIRAGQLIWVGSGAKTVDTQGIRERFEGLRVQVDWSKFESGNKIRNEIEHYYTQSNSNSVQVALAKLFGLITEFCHEELQVDLKKELGDALWFSFVQIAEVYAGERKICVETFKNFQSYSADLNNHVGEFCCEDCASDLIQFSNDGFAKCRSCDKEYDNEDVVVNLVGIVYGAENYISVMDGGDSSSVDCPECGASAFIANEMICAACGESQQTECQRCAIEIPLSEIGGKYCGYCQHMMSKDD